MPNESLEQRCKSALEDYRDTKRKYLKKRRDLSRLAVDFLHWRRLEAGARTKAVEWLSQRGLATTEEEVDAWEDARSAIDQLRTERDEIDDESREHFERCARALSACRAEALGTGESADEQPVGETPEGREPADATSVSKETLAALESVEAKCLDLLKSLATRKRYQDRFDPLSFSSNDAWILFEANAREVKLGRDARIIQQDVYTQNFWGLLDGEVDVLRVQNDGTKVLVDTMAADRPSPWFGEMSALGNRPANAEVRAKSAATLLSIPPPLFWRLYDDGPFGWFKDQIDRTYADRTLHSELRSFPELHDLTEEERRSISEVADFVSWERNEQIAQQGQPADTLYLLRSGCVVALRRDGSMRPHEILQAGAAFGEEAFSDNPVWTYTLVASQKTHAVSLPVGPLRERLAELGIETDVETAALERLGELQTGIHEETSIAEQVERLGFFEVSDLAKARAGLVIETSKCTRCNACVESCAAVHDDGIPRISKIGLGADVPGIRLVNACYHCETPECMSACNDGAIRRRVDGLIDFIWDNCTGCKACAKACPFDVIRIVRYPLEDEVLQRRELPFRSLFETLERAVKGPECSWTDRLDGWWKRHLAPRVPDCEHETSEYSENVVKGLKAVQCDHCYGLGYQACVFNCPCDAIHRRTPEDALELSERVGR